MEVTLLAVTYEHDVPFSRILMSILLRKVQVFKKCTKLLHNSVLNVQQCSSRILQPYTQGKRMLAKNVDYLLV